MSHTSSESSSWLQVMYSEGDKPISLAESLVKAGYARLVNWGLEMMSLGAHSLREAERNAKQQKLAIWRNYVAPASAGRLWACIVASPAHVMTLHQVVLFLQTCCSTLVQLLLL